VVAATVTPLASILGSGLLIIVPVLERTLGAWSVFGAAAICAVAWLVGTVIRHNVIAAEQRETAGTLDRWTGRLERLADVVIVVAYVISVALYLRIMAQYVVGFFNSAGSTLWEPIIACVAVGIIVVIGALRGFKGLNRLDRVSLIVVLGLTTVLGIVLLIHDGATAATRSLRLPPVPALPPLSILLILGGIVITVQGFETVRYLGAQYDAPTRVWASRVAQLVSTSIYIGFVAVATPVMGLGSKAGPDNTLLDITARIAPWLALPLVLSAVLSQFSAAIADTAAADGNLRDLNKWFRGPRPYLISGAAVIVLAAFVPTLTIVAVASRAFAAYYAIQSVIALRTSEGWARKIGFGTLAAVMLAVTLFAQPAS
jgi:amino acid transporter